MNLGGRGSGRAWSECGSPGGSPSGIVQEDLDQIGMLADRDDAARLHDIQPERLGAGDELGRLVPGLSQSSPTCFRAT